MVRVDESLDAACCRRRPKPFAGVFAACCSTVLDEMVNGEGSGGVIGEQREELGFFAGVVAMSPVAAQV